MATTKFEIQAILHDGTILKELIDPSNFVSNDIISDLTDSLDSRKLTFNINTFQDQESYSIQIRNIRSDGLPGVWSEIKRIQVSETQNYIVEIIPTNLVMDNGLKWIVEDSNGLVSGPYSYSATLDYGDYTLKIIDDQYVVIYEEEITVSSTNSYQEVVFDLEKSSLVITINIPEDSKLNINKLKYFLISDSNETVYESTGYSTFTDISVGYYNLMLKYQDTNILYLDDVYHTIEIDSDVNRVSVTINNQSKITALE